jgi:hypothetical protein
VNQGPRTIHTMVFEPEKLILHLSIGRGPTSAKPLHRLELRPIMRPAPDSTRKTRAAAVS